MFDVSLNEYSPDFEESQHFSPTFDGWAREPVDRLVRDYDIHGRQVIEIGCGKGEFLALLCEGGGNQGIGIDPGCIPERLQGDGASKVRFIRDLYSEQYAGLPGEVVCCRHTLEHIQPTGAFVQMVRRVIGPRKDTLVFFEVPDMTRVLRERAYWDIYYEHCTYFTAGSLARLFRSSGFEILELVRDFADQLPMVDGPADRRADAAVTGDRGRSRVDDDGRRGLPGAGAKGHRRLARADPATGRRRTEARHLGRRLEVRRVADDQRHHGSDRVPRRYQSAQSRQVPPRDGTSCRGA